jgi:hypothetical protein
MSLLHQERPEELDDAAKGESFTKGTSHVIWATVAATVVVTIAIAIYVVAGHKPPAATGEILEVWIHPMHVQTPAFDASGVSMPQDDVDQLLVFARVRLHNQSRQPLFLIHLMANATLDDGIHTSYAAMPSEYSRVFVVYPQLAAWRGTPLSPDITLEPGQTAEGTFVTSFHIAKQQWDARKGLNFGFGFRYQPVLTLTPQTPIIER